jgi:hypothetical protein
MTMRDLRPYIPKGLSETDPGAGYSQDINVTQRAHLDGLEVLKLSACMINVQLRLV